MTRVVLDTTPYCGYCRAAKHLLGKKGVTFTEIDVSEDMERRREMIERAFGRRSVPQIFLNDTHVGGYDELAELERAEKLDALLAEIGALAAVPGNDLGRGKHIPRRPGATPIGPRHRAEHGDGRGDPDPPRRGGRRGLRADARKHLDHGA